MKKKNIIIVIIAIIVLVVVVVGFILLKNNKVKKDDTKEEVFYTAYVKINPLVKLTFKNYKYACDAGTCYDYTEEVTKVEPLNDDAKEIFENVDLVGKRITDAFSLLCKTARDDGKVFHEMNIITNYNRFDNEEISKDLELDAVIKFQDQFNEEEIFDEFKANKYAVTFDSDGGSNIDKINVVANETINKPADPTKNGYKFMGWYLNDKSFDFTTKIDKDITLVAKWEKEESSTNTNPNKDNNKDNNNNNNNNNNSNNGNSNNDNKNNGNNGNDKNNGTSITTPTCQSKKFSHKYSYVYDDEATCKKQGNLAFFDVSDNVNPDVFTYGCEEIVDDCGKKYYGVYFNVYNHTTSQVDRYYY